MTGTNAANSRPHSSSTTCAPVSGWGRTMHDSTLSAAEIARTFQFDAAYDRHERGEITAAEYFDHLCARLSLAKDHARIKAGWNSIYVGEIAETMAMLRTARQQLPCHAFTNTN